MVLGLHVECNLSEDPMRTNERNVLFYFFGSAVYASTLINFVGLAICGGVVLQIIRYNFQPLI
jgi:hypothetical protein